MIAKYGSQATFVSIILGGLLFYAGGKLNVPFFTNLGIACFGLFFLVQGTQIMINRQASFLWSRGRRGEIAAQLWGGVFIGVAGLILLAAAANFFLPGGVSGYMERMLSHPFGWGMLLGVGGIFAVVYGLVGLLTGGQRAWTRFSDALANLRDWLVGLFFITAGLLLVLIGLGLIFAPDLLVGIGSFLLHLLENLL